jgi:hypothetical protein
VGKGESEQGMSMPVTEVYRRRDGLMSRSPLGTDKTNGAESSLIRASSRSDLLDEAASEGGLEESFVEDTDNESGHDMQGTLGESPPVTILKRKAGLRIEEMEVSPIRRDMKLAKEVGSIVGMTCDGKEEKQEDCLKLIVTEKYRNGGSSLGVIDQQEVDSIVQERGNCSDYEA